MEEEIRGLSKSSKEEEGDRGRMEPISKSGEGGLRKRRKRSMVARKSA